MCSNDGNKVRTQPNNSDENKASNIQRQLLLHSFHTARRVTNQSCLNSNTTDRCVTMLGTSRDIQGHVSSQFAFCIGARTSLNKFGDHSSDTRFARNERWSYCPSIAVLDLAPALQKLVAPEKNGKPVTTQCPPQSAQTALPQPRQTAPSHNGDGINTHIFGRVAHNARVRSKLSRQYSKLASAHAGCTRKNSRSKIQHGCSILKQLDVSAETRSLRDSGK